MARFLRIAVLAGILAATVFAQQSPSSATATAATPPKPEYVGKAIGRATVDNTPSYTTINLYKDETVSTNLGTHLHVISKGNTLIFAQDSKFQTWVNAFELKEGGSKVASYTGMTAYLPNCFSVTPVDPTQMTLFEVDWSQGTAYVYARSQDVKINYWADRYDKPDARQKPTTKDWIVKQGHVARVSDVAACKPLVFVWPDAGVPPEMAIVGAAAAGPTVSLILWGQSKISQDSP